MEKDSNECLEPGLLTFLVDNMDEDDYEETVGLMTHNDGAEDGACEELAKVTNMSPLSSQLPTDFWSPSPMVGKKRLVKKSTKIQETAGTGKSKAKESVSKGRKEKEEKNEPPKKESSKGKEKASKRRSGSEKPRAKKTTLSSKSNARSSRRSPRLQRTKSSSGVTLEELLKWELIGMRDEIHYEGEEGNITKDGWIEYNNQRFVNLEAFCNEVHKLIGKHTLRLGTYAPWDKITIVDADSVRPEESLEDIRMRFSEMYGAAYKEDTKQKWENQKKKARKIQKIFDQLGSGSSSEEADSLEDNEYRATQMNPSGISPFAKRANAAPASLDVAGGTLIDEDQIVFDHRKRVTPKPYGQRQLIKEQKELSTSKKKGSKPKEKEKKAELEREPSIDLLSSQDSFLSKAKLPGSIPTINLKDLALAKPASGSTWKSPKKGDAVAPEKEKKKTTQEAEKVSESEEPGDDFDNTPKGSSQMHKAADKRNSPSDEASLKTKEKTPIKQKSRSDSQTSEKANNMPRRPGAEFDIFQKLEPQKTESDSSANPPREASQQTKKSKKRKLSEVETSDSRSQRSGSETILKEPWTSTQKKKLMKQPSIESWTKPNLSSQDETPSLESKGSGDLSSAQQVEERPTKKAKTMPKETSISDIMEEETQMPVSVGTASMSHGGSSLVSQPFLTGPRSSRWSKSFENTPTQMSPSALVGNSDSFKLSPSISPQNSNLPQGKASAAIGDATATATATATTSTSTTPAASSGSESPKKSKTIPKKLLAKSSQPKKSPKGSQSLATALAMPAEAIESRQPESSTTLRSKHKGNYIFLGSGLKKAMLEQIIVFTHKLGGMMTKDWQEGVSHLIVQTDDKNCSPRTLKYLIAVLSGSWIVSYQWITDCLSNQKWLHEEKYEITGDSAQAIGAPKIARLALANPDNKRLFHGLKFYFAYPPDAVAQPAKEDLVKLILLGNGTELKTSPPPPTTAELFQTSTYIIVDSTCQPEYAKLLFLQTGRHPIKSMWIFDSISRYNLQDTDQYQVSFEDPNFFFETQHSLAF